MAHEAVFPPEYLFHLPQDCTECAAELASRYVRWRQRSAGDHIESIANRACDAIICIEGLARERDWPLPRVGPFNGAESTLAEIDRAFASLALWAARSDAH